MPPTAITTANVGMAHALSVEVIAEGVETEGQLRALRDLECELAQGFYLHPPLGADEVRNCSVPDVRTRRRSGAESSGGCHRGGELRAGWADQARGVKVQFIRLTPWMNALRNSSGSCASMSGITRMSSPKIERSCVRASEAPRQ
jgi:hypothetical protein